MIIKLYARRCLLVWLLSSLALLLGGGALVHAQEEPLRWEFSEGQQRYYRWSQNTTLKVDLGSTGKIQTVAEQVIDFSWRVEQARSDGSAVLVQKIERIQFKVTGPNQQSAQLDSSEEKRAIDFGGIMVPLVRVLIDQPVKLVLSSRGQVESVEVDESLLETLRNSPGNKKRGQQATETVLENLVRRISLPLPDTKTIKLDQQWTDTTELAQPPLGKLHLKTTFRYEGPQSVNEQTLDRFALKLVASLDNEETMRIVEQKSSGHALFDREAGWIESSATEQELSLQSVVDGHETPVTIHQTTRLQGISEADIVKQDIAKQPVKQSSQDESR